MKSIDPVASLIIRKEKMMQNVRAKLPELLCSDSSVKMLRKK